MLFLPLKSAIYPPPRSYPTRSCLSKQPKRRIIDDLDEESDRALKALALKTKVSESEHIRRAVKKYIARKKGKIAVKDPLQKLIGLCDKPEGPTDASIDHDKYLYRKQD